MRRRRYRRRLLSAPNRAKYLFAFNYSYIDQKESNRMASANDG